MGNEADLVAACRVLRPRLVGFLTLYCGDEATAEDLAQDALARLWLNWDRVQRLDSLDAWVHRVALNLAKSHFRRQLTARRARWRAPYTLSEDNTAPLADALTVRTAVAALPPRQRLAVLLRYFADLPVADAAAVMRCAPGTVRALTHQAVSRLAASDFDNEGHRHA